MKTAKALARIYSSVLESEGPLEAREYLAVILCNVIDDLKIDGLDVSPENIEKLLCERAKGYGDLDNQEVA